MRRTATVLAALAGFVPLPLPAEHQGDAVELQDFAASGNSWIARPGAGSRLLLTNDAGATWRRVDINFRPGAGISIGPDGGFWMAGSDGTNRQLIHITTQGEGTILPVAVTGGLMSPPAWDATGHMWVATAEEVTRNSGTLMRLIRLNPDGSIAEQLEGTSTSSSDFPWVKFAGGKVYAATTTSVFRADGSKLVLLSGGVKDPPRFLQTDLWPESVLGSTIIAHHAVTIDAGNSYGYTNRSQFVVHGDSDLLLRAPLSDQPFGIVLQKCSTAVFCDTGVNVPLGTASLWKTPAGLLAVGIDSASPTRPLPGDGRNLFQINRDPIPKQSADIGTSTAQSRKLMARLNFHRRQAGLPRLVVDARMNAAALAHARYLAKHVKRGKLDLSNAHVERRGTSGFTGEDPAKRCDAKGTLCTTEEVLSGPHPSDTLVSLYYHRLAPLSPFTQYGGAATVGRYTVYVLDTHREAFSIKPIGYPNGRYDGPLTLQGPELPDPWELCRPHAVGTYRGVPITFEPPAREPSRPANLRVEIRTGPDVKVFGTKLYIGRKAVPGCNNNGTFMPKPALRRHTNYTAKTRWQPSPDDAVQTYSWTFRTR